MRSGTVEKPTLKAFYTISVENRVEPHTFVFVFVNFRVPFVNGTRMTPPGCTGVLGVLATFVKA